MFYIWIAVVAYLLFALNGVVDKFLLTKAVRHPVAYAFYIGITGPLTFVLAPFGLKLVSFSDLFIAIIAGACFVWALYFLYVATQATSISRLLPIEGGFVPFFTLVFAYIVLGERLTSSQFVAFIFLVTGAVLIAFRKDAGHWHPKALGYAVIAAALFALSFVLTKYIFNQTNFVSGLIWTRLGFFAVSLSFLIPSSSRRHIADATKEATPGNKILYYGARLSGGLAGLMQNYAISLGSVIIVNALQGVQYAFLLLLTIFFSEYYPNILKERITKLILAQKILAIVLISLGLYFLTQ
ncbi:MAG: EamA family transporter [Candidatus Doudnabacteria bacterium]|nr:EamA family transporter [bacterium]MDZ4244111.1 EamA family transporter [Candidatus Doudnabacteria bacterium]